MKRDTLVVTLMLCTAALTASHPFPQEGEFSDVTNFIDEEPDPERLSDYLVTLLTSPVESSIPLVFIQEEIAQPPEIITKRSRYYRRYPWKRQNGRIYEPEGYLCAPTREDVFQLLLALHETRSGNGDRTISFCNRRRPARAILTNMRFLGKR